MARTSIAAPAFTPPFAWPRVGSQWPIYNVVSEQADNLEGWWPTLGKETVYLKDYTRNAFSITTAVGASVIHDPEMGGGVSIGSSNGDRLEHPDEALLSDLSEFTLSGWFRCPNTSGSRILVCKWGITDQLEYAIRLTGNSIYLYVNTGGVSGTTDSVQLASTWSVNELYFIAATYKDPEMVIYLNGKLDNSNTHSLGGSTADSTSPINIGGRNWSTAYDPFNGNLFDVRISLVARTADEIERMYNKRTRWELYQSPRHLWAIRFVAVAAVRVPRYGFTNFQIPGIV